MDLLAIVIYGQPSRAATQNRNWITTIVVGCSRANDDARHVAEATFAAAQKLVPRGTRMEMHHAGVIAELPNGKSFDAPDWTDGEVRVWDCPMLGDLAPAADPNPEPGTEIEPRPGHRHDEERMKRG